MGLAEIKAGLIKKGYSIESLKDKTEPKAKKEIKPAIKPKKKISLPEPKKENEPEVETESNNTDSEHQCNECGETPEDCKCDDCDCVE